MRHWSLRPIASALSFTIFHESDEDFGNIGTLETEVKQPALPSQRIEPAAVAHLSHEQRVEYLAVLDRFASVFGDVPGLCTVITHEINMSPDFQPRKLHPYRIPDHYKQEVKRQIDELLAMHFIERSTSRQISPLVCVLKPPDAQGHRAVRIYVDFQYVNRHVINDVTILDRADELLQAVGNSKFISKFDAKSGYHHCQIKPEHRWLTAFVFDNDIFNFVRSPFGLVNSGDTFVKAMMIVLRPIRRHTKSYIDDLAVHSMSWQQHLADVTEFLQTMKNNNITLGLPKSEFAKPQVKLVGHIVGSGTRMPDPKTTTAAVSKIKEPVTKKQLRQALGFFSFWREYIPHYSHVAKPLTDLTGKRVANNIQFTGEHRAAFQQLKTALCEAVNNPLHIINPSKPFYLFVDASQANVGACLAKPHYETNRPIAFASAKLSETQQRYSTIEKEAYAALWGLTKFRHWILGRAVTVFSDHNPITYLNTATPKTAKLMRWALAIEEFNAKFVYRPGKMNQAADYLSREVDHNSE